MASAENLDNLAILPEACGLLSNLGRDDGVGLRVAYHQQDRASDARKKLAPGSHNCQILKELEIKLHFGFCPGSKLYLVPLGIEHPGGDETFLGRERFEAKNALPENLLVCFFFTSVGWSSILQRGIFQNNCAGQLGIVSSYRCCGHSPHRMSEEIRFLQIQCVNQSCNIGGQNIV